MWRTDTSLELKSVPLSRHIGLEHGTPTNLSSHPLLTLTNIYRGGSNTSITVTNNQQWTGFKNSLRDTPKSVVEIRVILKSSELNGWKKPAALMVGSKTLFKATSNFYF